MSNDTNISTAGFVNPTGPVSRFAKKNATRKNHYRPARDEDRRTALEARSLRRQLGGAFGNEPEVLQELAVVGTGGTVKKVDKPAA